MMAIFYGLEFGKVRAGGWKVPGQVVEITPIFQRLGTPKVI
jgi:hypothetical protein